MWVIGKKCYICLFNNNSFITMKEIKNSKAIFSLALGINNPWYLETIEFIEVEGNPIKELHIHINFHRGSTFTSPDGSPSKCYDTEEKVWRHLDFFQHKCYLHARVPRIKDGSGNIRQVIVPWARTGSGFTLLFEAYSMFLIEGEMPVNNVANTLKVAAHRLWRVFNYWLETAKSKDDLSEVSEIGIDETSVKKGHKYITIVADMVERRVINAQAGKDSKIFDKFAEQLEQKGGNRNNIKQICIDMSHAYIAGARATFPNGQITFDKFHIVQHLNIAMDTVRKEERKGNDLLKGHKYTFLRSNKTLSNKKRNELDYLNTLYPTLGSAYRLKEIFLDIFSIKKPKQAIYYLEVWCNTALVSGIQPFIDFVKLIKRHWVGVTNYFYSRLTNGILEGINSKIQLAKRRARGYRNIKNFINMILFTCGKLKFDYPYKTT